MNSADSTFCGTCALAVASVIAVPIVVSAISSGGIVIDLGRIDWQSVGALGSFAAAWAALSAARAALAVDARNAARAVDREIREATPLAHAIQRELYQASAFGKLWADLADEMGADLVAMVKHHAPSVDCPTLRSSIGRLGCFDYRVGASLGAAAVIVSALQLLLSAREPVENEVALQVFKGRLKNYCQQLVAASDQAATLLTPYTGMEMHDGKLDVAEASRH